MSRRSSVTRAIRSAEGSRIMRSRCGALARETSPRPMLPPDLALALLINRTGQAYTASAPAYITYTERTHITATIGRSQDINRSVVVRNADNFAVMKDLPNGR